MVPPFHQYPIKVSVHPPFSVKVPVSYKVTRPQAGLGPGGSGPGLKRLGSRTCWLLFCRTDRQFQFNSVTPEFVPYRTAPGGGPELPPVGDLAWLVNLVSDRWSDPPRGVTEYPVPQ
eukprot:763819-Hanusia_phi.AAC.2